VWYKMINPSQILRIKAIMNLKWSMLSEERLMSFEKIWTWKRENLIIELSESLYETILPMKTECHLQFILFKSSKSRLHHSELSSKSSQVELMKRWTQRTCRIRKEFIQRTFQRVSRSEHSQTRLNHKELWFILDTLLSTWSSTSWWESRRQWTRYLTFLFMNWLRTTIKSKLFIRLPIGELTVKKPSKHASSSTMPL